MSGAQPERQSDIRFLLYLDILGFSNLVKNEPEKVEKIYAVLDSLNGHRHSKFTTIVFSDTLLIYNKEKPVDDDASNVLVSLLLEFAEDLHHRLTGQNVYFRAIVLRGDFNHKKMTNIESFYGKALITAYELEKMIPCVGLFIHESCSLNNKYFPTTPYFLSTPISGTVSFVHLNRHLEYLNEMSGGEYPVDGTSADDTAPYAPWQVRFLRDVYENMRTHADPRVRAKFLANWDFHCQRYPTMMRALVDHNFELTALATGNPWSDFVVAMESDIADFNLPSQRV